MGLNYDFGDKSENLTRMNQFIRQKMLDFLSILALKIWDNQYDMGRSVCISEELYYIEI